MTSDPDIRTYRGLVARFSHKGHDFLMVAESSEALDILSEPYRMQRELDPALCRQCLVMTSEEVELRPVPLEEHPAGEATPELPPQVAVQDNPTLPEGIPMKITEPVQENAVLPKKRGRPRKEVVG